MSESIKKRGQLTLPAEAGMDDTVNFLAEKWGVDAIRDSDGTQLSENIMSMGYQVYSTLCLIRADQEWAKAHPECCQQKFLMSDPVTANSETVVIDIQRGFSKEQFQIDTRHDIKKYWQVFDRTTGEEVPLDAWDFNADDGAVTLRDAQKWHLYTVNFLVYQIWETTSMYNHITNNWTDEHQMGIDPYQPEAGEHLLVYLQQWLDSHPHTDVVRFTAMMYQFPIITNEERQTRWMDWSTYLDCISPKALDDFEKKYGYRLTSEDLVDKGYYCKSDIVPSQKYLDWIEFISDFVVDYAARCVEIVHKANRKAMLFFCDHWIGTEPFHEKFQTAGFDSLVSPCINGIEVRRIADVPGDLLKEVRLYPYFFPENLMGEPLFEGGGDPEGECRRYWMKIRRAMLRACVDRIGFGGYLRLAKGHEGFLNYVTQLADEFREIHDKSGKTKPQALLGKVVIINAWGKIRSWIMPEPWPHGALYEALAGMPVDIEFMSFDDLVRDGIPEGTRVLINAGPAMTAWSGGEHWTNPKLVETIREFVNAGGGFIGIDNPTACEHQGRYFQLADVLGVQREIGLSGGAAKLIKPELDEEHFILEDANGSLDLGYPVPGVYAASTDLKALALDGDNILLSANTFGSGRGVYLTNFTLSHINTRMLFRAICWAGGQESELKKAFSSNVNTDCAYYPETGQLALVNHTDEPQQTDLYDANGQIQTLTLEPGALVWKTE